MSARLRTTLQPALAESSRWRVAAGVVFRSVRENAYALSSEDKPLRHRLMQGSSFAQKRGDRRAKRFAVRVGVKAAMPVFLDHQHRRLQRHLQDAHGREARR